MNIVAILCVSIVLVACVHGEEKKKHTKQEVDDYVNALMENNKKGQAQLDAAMAEEGCDQKHKDFYQKLKDHLITLMPKKQAVLDQLEKDGEEGVDKAIESLKAILIENQKDMEEFKKEHDEIKKQ